MKKFTSILFLSLLPYLVVSMSPQEKAPLIHHMEEINIEWANKGYDDQYNFPGSFINDNERIRKHLELVEHHLRNETHRFNQLQLENRNALLDVLNGYHQRGQFPKNTFHAERIPYFIDIYGTACAVGYLMIESGYEALAEKIRSEGNYRYIREIDYPEVVEWAEKHGFTLEELAWIQPGYPSEILPLPLGDGVNGEVQNLSILNNNPIELIITGNFSEAGNIPCKTIAIWNGESYSCPLVNLEGEVHHILNTYQEVIFTGHFQYNQENYNLLTIENGNWDFVQIFPEKNVTITGFMQTFKYDYAAGFYEVGDKDNEYFIAIRERNTQTNWEIIALLNGKVNSVSSSFSGNFYLAGEFTMINGEEINYIGFYSPDSFGSSTGTFHQLGEGLDSPVNLIKEFNGIIYAAGNIINDEGERNFGFSRYHNNQWQQLIGESNYYSQDNSPAYINDFTFHSNAVYLGGRFEVGHGQLISYFGYNVARFDLLSGNIGDFGIVNDDVNSIVVNPINGQFYIGGKFKNNSMFGSEGGNLNHLAKLSNITGIDNRKTYQFKIYPNPAVDRITIELENHYQNLQLSLFSMDGRQVEPDYQTTSNEIILNRQHLPDGIYQLKVFEENELIGSSRVVFTGK